MGKYDKLLKQKELADREMSVYIDNLANLENAHGRLANIYENSSVIIDDIEAEFNKVTGLSGVDVSFLFFATALQCVRQYILTPFRERMDNQTAAKTTIGHIDEHSDRLHRYYHPSLEEIQTNPVPFDANLQSEQMKGVLKGAGKLGHRLTPGHDPVLGWVIGTANIATSTLTRWDLQSFHVKTGLRNVRGGGTAPSDMITNHAKTDKVLSYTWKRLCDEGMEGKLVIIESLRKEWVHLKSDINTKNSLPFPAVAVFSPQTANGLAEYGIDAANLQTVAKQVTIAEAINYLVATIHGMLCYTIACNKYGSERLPYDNTEVLNLCKVKTKKIILYSNTIASLSNLIYVGVNAACQNYDAVRSLDVGGIMVTIHRLLTDTKFIRDVKHEFIKNRWAETIINNDIRFEVVE